MTITSMHAVYFGRWLMMMCYFDHVLAYNFGYFILGMSLVWCRRFYGHQAQKKKNSWKVYPKSFFSYLSDVQVFCKETLVIFIHSELNFCFQAIVTNLSLWYTRQEFLKKQLFLNQLQSDPPMNWFVLGGTLQFANITFLTSFQKVVQCSWHCSYFPVSQ